MPGRGHSKRRREIHVPAPVDVPDVIAFGAIPNDGPITVGVDKSDVSGFERPEKI
jgi:hypothetical protein